MSAGHLLRMLAMDIAGLNAIALIKGKTGKPGMDEFKRKNPSPRWLRLAY
jgi:hypothetical protein